jgi:hypothetical protein
MSMVTGVDTHQNTCNMNNNQQHKRTMQRNNKGIQMVLGNQ